MNIIYIFFDVASNNALYLSFLLLSFKKLVYLWLLLKLLQFFTEPLKIYLVSSIKGISNIFFLKIKIILPTLSLQISYHFVFLFSY